MSSNENTSSTSPSFFVLMLWPKRKWFVRSKDVVVVVERAWSLEDAMSIATRTLERDGKESKNYTIVGHQKFTNHISTEDSKQFNDLPDPNYLNKLIKAMADEGQETEECDGECECFEKGYEKAKDAVYRKGYEDGYNDGAEKKKEGEQEKMGRRGFCASLRMAANEYVRDKKKKQQLEGIIKELEDS